MSDQHPMHVFMPPRVCFAVPGHPHLVLVSLPVVCEKGDSYLLKSLVSRRQLRSERS